MRLRLLVVTWLALPALAGAQITWSQQAPSTPAAYLARIDRDHDGRIDPGEYVDYLSAGFRRLDRNGDGVLASDERPGGHGRTATLTHWQANLRQQFGKLDRDHDSYLDARELAQPPQP
jgi:Ca2+-binding EF-hand superfamily protein